LKGEGKMNTPVTCYIEKLLCFGLKKGLLEEADVIFARNQLLDIMGMDAAGEAIECDDLPETATSILEPLINDAVARGLTGDTQTERDLFDTRLMGALMPRPSQIRRTFDDLMKNEGAKAATDWFYDICRSSNYIRVDQVARNIAWDHESSYGKLTVTINLSKPEKDPKEIAKLKNAPAAGYPACMLCKSNEGYAGRLNFPARQTHRVIPLTLGGEEWYFQYSPYVYYPEHCIVFKGEHTPMKVCRASFNRLMDFSDQLPHYFIGSNAGLPVVGGSILNHDHFQGGRYELPMTFAKDKFAFMLKDFPEIKATVLDWPMTVIRLRTTDRTQLLDAADKLHETWWHYSDAERNILAEDPDGTPHNTFTPILRRKGELYEMDLVLRNNVTTEEYPLGIYHPHSELHHIKKENIGLIEVMGLFILPGRLEKELEAVARIWAGVDEMPADIEDAAHPVNKHLHWLKKLLAEGMPESLEDARAKIRLSVGDICVRVLQDCAVFKEDEDGQKGLKAYLEACGGVL